MAELINPFLGYRMSQGWTQGSHANNPAMDYATPIGFRFRAPASGVYRHLPTNLSRTDTSAAGRMGELTISGGRWNGFRIRFAHLSQHIAASGARVSQSDILAATGNTGFVRPNPDRPGGNPYDGAHMHTYGLTPGGARWNWTLYADSSAPATGGDSRPFEPEEDDMYEQSDRDATAAIRTGVQAILNALNDKNIGIHDHVLKASGASRDNLAVSKNIENIVAGLSNSTNDPNIGLTVVTNETRDLVRALKIGDVNIDVDALAQSLQATLAPAVVKALGEALLSQKD